MGLPSRPRVLIAAPALVIRQLGRVLPTDEIEVLGAATWEDAAKQLAERPDVIVICYVFDEMRPYRFIHSITESDEARGTPILLVRAVSVPLGDTPEADLRHSYAGIGVSEFLNFSDEANQYGLDAALDRFKGVVMRLLASRRR